MTTSRFSDVATPYLASQVLTCLALAVPHAILTPMLLAKDLTLSQILVMQAAYSASVLPFEFPSGAIADILSRRRVYLFSRAVLCIFFLLVISGFGFHAMLIAWIIYGFTSALDTGTLEAALVNNAKHRSTSEDHLEQRVSWLVRKESQTNFAGMIVGSLIGAALFGRFAVGIYVVSIAAVVMAMGSVLLFFCIPEQQGRSRERGFSDGTLVSLYLTFIALSFAGSYIHVERFFEHRWIVAAGLTLLGICAALLYSVPNTTYVLFYVLAVVVFIALSNYCTFGVCRSSSIERIGAVTSLVSLCGRLGAVATLIAASLGARSYSASAVVSVGFAALTAVSAAWAMKKPLSTM